MGPHTRVQINDNWTEPLILWSVVLADKGQKKSPALNRLLEPIKIPERKLIQDTAEQQMQHEDLEEGCEYILNISQWKNYIIQ